MSGFTIHTIDSAPAASREIMRAVEKKFGFLPNLIGEMAEAPATAQAYVTLSQLLEQTSLSPVEQQLVLVSVSVANGCHYCVAAHSAGLKQAGLPDDQIEAVRENRPLRDERLEALRAFTTAVVETRGHPTSGDLDGFRNAGYGNRQILEVLVGVAMKTISNYTNHIAETPLDEQLQPFAWEGAAAS